MRGDEEGGVVEDDMIAIETEPHPGLNTGLGKRAHHRAQRLNTLGGVVDA
jgi:hypothetical protein